MTYSHSRSESHTFNRTHAKQIASKVVSDLRLLRILYGEPSEASIAAYHEELVELLAGRYLASIEYGFKQNGKRIVSLHYRASFDGTLQTDDDAGKVPRGAAVSDASWFSYATYSAAYDALSADEKNKLKERLPFKRTSGGEPRDGDGVWVVERTYSASVGGVRRQSFRPA